MVPLLQADNMELKMIDQFAIVNALKLERKSRDGRKKWKVKGLKKIVRKF